MNQFDSSHLPLCSDQASEHVAQIRQTTASAKKHEPQIVTLEGRSRRQLPQYTPKVLDPNSQQLRDFALRVLRLNREVLHRMCQPQPCCFGIIRGHAELPFHQRIQFVEEVCIGADPCGHGEKSGLPIAREVQVFHPPHRDPSGSRAQASPGCGHCRKWQSEIMGQRVRGTKRDDA